jgi:origin recognition complex subunit 1
MESSVGNKCNNNTSFILETNNQRISHNQKITKTYTISKTRYSPSKIENIFNIILNKFKRVRSSLLVSYVPKTMVERENEEKIVHDFLVDFIFCKGKSEKYLFISGVSGTGKTAVVLKTIHHLYQKTRDGEIPRFKFVEINALSLNNPLHVFCKIWKVLTGEVLSPKKAYDKLEIRYSICNEKSTEILIILLDEIDILIDRRQHVFYCLFDWQRRPEAKIAIIGITNMMNLPDLIASRTRSRMGLFRWIQFMPYTSEQMENIIRDRIESSCFRKNQKQKYLIMDNFNLAIHKITLVTGDLRRLLEICKRSVEIATADLKNAILINKKTKSNNCCLYKGVVPNVSVNIHQVNRAIQELYDSRHNVLYFDTPRHVSIYLAAICQEIKYTGRIKITFESALRRYKELCFTFGESIRFLSRHLLEITYNLCETHLLACEAKNLVRHMRLYLLIPRSDLETILVRKKDIKWMEKIFGN